MKACEIIFSLLILPMVVPSLVIANDSKTPEWVIESVPERLAGLLAQGVMFDVEMKGFFLLPVNRTGRWTFLSPEGEHLTSFEVPDGASRIVDGEQSRLFLGFVTPNRIYPVAKNEMTGVSFETVDGLNVRGHRARDRTLFARWGYSSYPFGEDSRAPLAGFTVYDQDGRIVLEKGEDTGFFFRQLLNEAVVVADHPDERESRFKLIGFDGKIKATFGEPRGDEVISSLFSQRCREYIAVSTLRLIESKWKRTFEIYRDDGKKVAQIENTRGVMWRFHGHYFIGLSMRHDRWERRFQIHNLQTGDQIKFTQDLQTGRREGDDIVEVADIPNPEFNSFRPNTFSGGERLMVLRVQDEEKGGSFLRACVLDVSTSEIVWTGEPQQYQVEGENVEGYKIIERYIGYPVPGDPDALFIFTEAHGPSILRRIPPVNK